MAIFKNNTDSDWEKFGQTDPYYGVLSDDKFLRGNLNKKNREEFFESGRDYVADLLKKLEPYFAGDRRLDRVLDFGCGVGRLVIPLAESAGQITGVDVSNSMLCEAKRNCREFSVKNVELLLSDDSLSVLQGEFDLIHSCIVFQHIPPVRGMLLLEKLLKHLKKNGVGAIHLSYGRENSGRTLIRWLRCHVPLVNSVANLLRGRKFFAPQMQMNSYDLNAVFALLARFHCRKLQMETTKHGGELGLMLFFEKP